MSDRDPGDENEPLHGCPCCGGDGTTCNYSPFGCTPKVKFDASPLAEQWPNTEERAEYETWSAIVALKNIRPDFLKPEALQWLKERE